MAINKYPNLAISETNTSGKYFGKNNSKLAGGQTTDNDVYYPGIFEISGCSGYELAM